MTFKQKKAITDAADIIRDWCKENKCIECPYYRMGDTDTDCSFTEGHTPVEWVRPVVRETPDEILPPTEEELHAALRTIKRQCSAMEDCEYCALHYTEKNCLITDFDAPMEWNMQRRMPDGKTVKLL